MIDICQKEFLKDQEEDCKIFLQQQLPLLKDFIHTKESNKENHKILDWIMKIRGTFFMIKTYETIDPIYQDLCKIAISLKIKTKDWGIENYIKYFAPNDPYILRIQALEAFRLLHNPQEQIEPQFFVCLEFLNRSLEIEKNGDNREKAREILKEYFDKLLAIKGNEGVQYFLGTIGGNTLWNTMWTEDDVLQKWLKEEYFDAKENVIEKEKNEEETHEKEIIDMTDTIWLLKEEIKQLEENYQQLKEENQRLRELQGVTTSNSIGNIYQDSEQPKEEIKVNINPDRKFYRIGIVGGSDKVMKKYTRLQKKLDLSLLGLQWSQLEIISDYSGQKTLKTSDIKNTLLSGNTDIILAIQTDHETKFANLCKSGEFSSQITIFESDDVYNGQSLTEARFMHYLQKALEKYERGVLNSNG